MEDANMYRYFMANWSILCTYIWYILWFLSIFGILILVLVRFTKRNLAALLFCLGFQVQW
jgi:hypothetical protein